MKDNQLSLKLPRNLDATSLNGGKFDEETSCHVKVHVLAARTSVRDRCGKGFAIGTSDYNSFAANGVGVRVDTIVTGVGVKQEFRNSHDVLIIRVGNATSTQTSGKVRAVAFVRSTGNDTTSSAPS